MEVLLQCLQIAPSLKSAVNAHPLSVRARKSLLFSFDKYERNQILGKKIK